ncbi:MAG: DUF1127 domain-containing protein [Paracoccaceae bacterium]|nr:MAG: DUF1127 domain-containing protein [Paracoccaceae bacterium]
MLSALSRTRQTRRPHLLSRLVAALTLARSRARLATLDDHLLRDIGLDRAQAEAEAARAPWDVPDHWRKG